MTETITNADIMIAKLITVRELLVDMGKQIGMPSKTFTEVIDEVIDYVETTK